MTRRGNRPMQIRDAVILLVVGVVAVGVCAAAAGATVSHRRHHRRPGCGLFCQQAGPAGGDVSEGCNGVMYCPPCPVSGCVAVLSRSARDMGGVVALRVRCTVRRACSGAFLLMPPNYRLGQGGSEVPMRDWVGGSDFRVGPRRTAEIQVALTVSGRRLARRTGGVSAIAWVVLHGYDGIAAVTLAPGVYGLPRVVVRG